MHELERRAQQDPLLLDLMIGIEKAAPETADAHIADIHQLINERVAGNELSARKTGRIWIAAASILFAFLVIGGWWLKNNQSEAPIVAQQSSSEKQSVPQVAEAPKTDSTPLIAANPPAKRPVEEIARRKLKTRVLASRAARVTAPPADSQAHLLAGRAVAVLKKNDTLNERESKPVLLSGIVTDKVSREPLPGVIVKTGDQTEATQTDRNGRFALSVPDDKKTLAVSSIGYENQQIDVQGKDSLQIAMIPNSNSLNEVVVVGYGAQKKNTIVGSVRPMQTRESHESSTILDARKRAKPLIGWKAYDRYLSDATQSLDGSKGIVTVAFRISEEGKPIDIVVINGLTDQTNEQAIEIIRNGAKWENLPDNITIKLALTFK